MKNRKPRYNFKMLIMLHAILLIYSLGGYFSKTAAQADFFGIKFVVCYAAVLLILGVYAIAWQQIIKRVPLTTAYANKAVTVVWGIIWGFFFGGEQITAGKLVGAAFIIVGIVIYAIADAKKE